MSKTVEGAKLKKAVWPADYLPFGSSADLPTGPKATAITATFSGGHSTR